MAPRRTPWTLREIDDAIRDVTALLIGDLPGGDLLPARAHSRLGPSHPHAPPDHPDAPVTKI